MFFTFENNVRTILASDVAAGASTIIVKMTNAPRNDPPTPSSEARLTLMDDLDNPEAIEVISYTGISASSTNGTITLTGVSKGLEGTSDQVWYAGDDVIQTLTKESYYVKPRIAQVRQLEASGNGGGTATGGAWNTRKLNTVIHDDIGVSVSTNANSWTMPAGRYWLEAAAPANAASGHILRCVDAAGSSTAVLLYGQAAHAGLAETSAHLTGVLSTTGSEVFKLQHYVNGADSLDTMLGVGVGVTSVDERFASVWMQKLD